jgi:hypothetical protein
MPVSGALSLARDAAEDGILVQSNAPIAIGFLTVQHEAGGYLGGYLVTNTWGRPLEFRLSTAVQPNRVQQILYGQSLAAYLYGELIGKTLVEKTAIQAGLIFTDRQAVLEMRNSLDVPVVWVAAAETSPEAAGLIVSPADERRPALVTHAKFPNDLPRIKPILQQLENGLDLLEPFGRVREAMVEARKMGVTNRG